MVIGEDKQLSQLWWRETLYTNLISTIRTILTPSADLLTDPPPTSSSSSNNGQRYAVRRSILIYSSNPCYDIVHGSLARAGKVKSQTPKVEAQEKKKTPKGRAKKRILYNRR